MMLWTASIEDLSGVPRTKQSFRGNARVVCHAYLLSQDGCAVFNAADRTYYLSQLACCTPQRSECVALRSDFCQALSQRPPRAGAEGPRGQGLRFVPVSPWLCQALKRMGRLCDDASKDRTELDRRN